MRLAYGDAVPATTDASAEWRLNVDELVSTIAKLGPNVDASARSAPSGSVTKLGATGRDTEKNVR